MAEITSPNRRKDIGPAPGGHLDPLNRRRDKVMFRVMSFSRITSPPSEKQPKSPLGADQKTGLSARATMPLLSQLRGQKSVKAVEGCMQGHQRTSSSPRMYVLSRFFGLVGQLLNYSPAPTSALAQTMMDLPTGGLPPLFCPALVFGLPLRSRIECLFESQALGQVQESTAGPPPWTPDIEVKSRRKANGRFIWKELMVVLDTACMCNNWVSLDVVNDLGIQYMPLSSAEKTPAQTAGGLELVPIGKVDLTWRGISGRQIRNCLRNFEMRFLVIDMEHPPFEILIGRDSLWECRILEAPMLAITPKHNTPVLPRPRDGKKGESIKDTGCQQSISNLWIVVVDKRGLDERKEENRRLMREWEAERNPAEAEAEVSENTVGDIGNDHDEGKVVNNKRKIPSMGFEEPPSAVSLRSPRSWRIRKHNTQP
jgi:hypothetical protein